MNALVLQCGGPTAVVNASLASLVRRWGEAPGRGTLYGGRYGLAALASGDWLPLAERGTSGEEGGLGDCAESPGMALGGGRDRLDGDALAEAVARLDARGVTVVFLIGGNGTMAAGRALAERARQGQVSLRVVGVPKTIDNDIPGTDLCPGFPSAARFLVEAVRDVAADASSMRGYEDVVLVEAMGRHAGWLAAASALAKRDGGDPPHILLLPEEPLDVETFLQAVRDQHARDRFCLVTVAEGVRDASGTFLAERCGSVERDASGQIILGRSGGPLPFLAALVRERLGLRCRLVRPDVLQRCSRAHVTRLDRAIAAAAGGAAVQAADCLPAGGSCMIALRGTASAWRAEPLPLEAARGERTVPLQLRTDERALRRALVDAGVHPGEQEETS